MKREARLGLAAIVLVIALPACHPLGGSRAERVNVPLSVNMRLTRTAKQDCGKKSCAIRFAVRITEQGRSPVYARDCHALALDDHGHTVVQSDFVVGFPAGAYVDPTRPWRSIGSIAFRPPLSPKKRSLVHSLQGSCVAYVWHGEVPI